MADKPEEAKSSTAAPTETGAEPPRRAVDYGTRKDIPPRATPRRIVGAVKTPGASIPRAASLAPGTISKGMAELYGTIGMFLSALDPEVGTALGRNADTIGEAWEKICAESDTMRGVAEKVLAGNAWGGFIIAHVPVGLAIKSSVDNRRAQARLRREAAEAETINGVKIPGPNVKPNAA